MTHDAPEMMHDVMKRHVMRQNDRKGHGMGQNDMKKHIARKKTQRCVTMKQHDEMTCYTTKWHSLTCEVTK